MLCRFGDSSTSFDEPQHATELRELIQSADGSVGKIGAKGNGSERFHSKGGDRNRCGLGAASTAPNKKRFGAVLATAPSPASLMRGEKAPAPIGGLFRRAKNGRGERMESGASFTA